MTLDAGRPVDSLPKEAHHTSPVAFRKPKTTRVEFRARKEAQNRTSGPCPCALSRSRLRGRVQSFTWTIISTSTGMSRGS
jgi:hypothetical protein